MKRHLLSKGLLMPLVGLLSLLPTTSRAAMRAQINFEENIPSHFTCGAQSRIERSDLRSKDGRWSMLWSWDRPSELIYADAETLSRSFQNPKAGVMFWIYNATPIDDDLHFTFETPDGQVARHFDFHMDFKGWRACWIKYFDMEGEGEKCPLARMRVTTPARMDQGQVWIDRMSVPETRLHEKVTPDQQIPNNNYHHDYTHWTRIWLWEQWEYDLPLTTPTPRQMAEMKVIADRLDMAEQKELPSVKLLMQKLLPEAMKIYKKADIHRLSDGSFRGAPLLSNDECDTKAGEIRNIDVEEMLYTFSAAALLTADKESEERFFEVFDYAMDQGFAYGSCQGTNHHYGYNVRKTFRAMWNMRHKIAERGKTDEYLKTLLFWSGLAETRRPFAQPRQGLVDTWHTKTEARIYTAMMIPDAAERLRALKALSRWMSGSLAITDGTYGGLKADGTAFHHGGFYPAYSVGAFAGMGYFCRATIGTEFQLEEAHRRNFKFALQTLDNYTAHRDWGLGIAGRHPFAKNNRIPKGDVNAFAYLALQGDLTGQGHSFDHELAADYLRLGGTDKGVTAYFLQNGITPSKAREGFFVYNYGAYGVHRRGHWMVSLKAYNTDVWNSEIYTRDNRFGRYQSYGTVQIFATSPDGKSDATSYDSGYSQAGWDWNRPSGGTTIHLPYDKLNSPFKGTQMEHSPNRFSGTSSLEGRNGVLAFHLTERDRPTFTPGATAFKSVFCFDNRLVFIGSGITNTNTEYPTETTLFQTRLDSPAEAILNGRKSLTAFPLNLTIASTDNDPQTITDTKGIIYKVKGDAEIHLLKQTQTSPDDKRMKPQSGSFATAYINHGTAPREASYEYMALIEATPEQLKALKSDKDFYRVLRRDNRVHAVRDLATGITAYACYEEFRGEDFVRRIDAETIFMERTTEDGGKVVSICTPDLGITEKTYVTAQPSQPLERTVELEGRWTAEEGDRCVLSTENGITQIKVTCLHGQPVELHLKRSK